MQPQVSFELLNFLELETHTDQNRRLNVREVDGSTRQRLPQEIQLRKCWNQVHDQVEVNHVLRILVQSSQVEYRYILFQELLLHRFDCLMIIRRLTLTLILILLAYELERQRARQLSEFIAE